jgi:two-component system OmpR family response regulator
MRILLIEDDERLATYVAKGLGEAGHLVTRCADGREGLLVAAGGGHELIILDRMLPVLDGMAVLQTLRTAGNGTPILILTALSDVDERVRGLRNGADDYLPKPFSMAELVARVEALGRRPVLTAENTRLVVADLEVDLLARTVKRAGKRIDLTQREFRVLEILVKNQGQVMTRSMMLERVWDYSFDPQTNIVDQFMNRLRNKIDRDFKPALIHTVRGTGYVIRAEI